MRLLILILLLSGCAHQPTFDRKTVCIDMEIVDYDLMLNGEYKYGIAYPNSKPCKVKINREHYTHEIIGHETRHCFDGFWHK